MKLRNIVGSAKSVIAVVVGLAIAVAVIGGIAEGARSWIFLSLLENEWPSVRPGQANVSVYRLAWPDGVQLTMTGDTDKSRLTVGGVDVLFGTGPAASYDPACGSFCRRAIVLDALRCVARKGPAGADSTACAFHMWESDTAEETCFVSLEKSIGPKYVLPEAMRLMLGLDPGAGGLADIGVASKPDDMHLDCPSGVFAHAWPVMGAAAP